MYTRHILLLLTLSLSAHCNTEKVIFLAPQAIQIPTAHPTLEDLHLAPLTPHSPTQRTHLRAEFPRAKDPDGVATWLLLDKLHACQRYEVRVCWAATQPTSFRLDVYELEQVFSNADLITSLAQFSATRQPPLDEAAVEQSARSAKEEEVISSMLFLRIMAAADYYTMNQTLMRNVPPVHVDVILDPYLLNAFPTSLVPTAMYIIVVAIGAWFLSKSISTWLVNLRNNAVDDREKKQS